MNPLTPNAILRIGLSCAAALALAAPAGAHNPSMVGQYGWGAAATYAKQQERAALAARADSDLVTRYGWGAAAAYAKLHA